MTHDISSTALRIRRVRQLLPRCSGKRNYAPLKDWTLELVRRLETDIRSVDPEFDTLHIWRDEQIDPTIYLTDELRAKVTQSGILFIVMSPRYLSSTWCRDELEWFKRQVQDRSRDQGRLFVIRALPTDENSWPDFLRDERGYALIGFRFHGEHDPMPFGWRGSRDNNEVYVRQLGHLRTALMKRVRDLRAKSEAQLKTTSNARILSDEPKRVYLHARSEHATVREEIRRLLTDDGIEPLIPIIDVGRNLADLTRESRVRIEVAKRCDALALVRGDDDTSFVGDLIDVGIRERERMQIARGTSLPCAVLDRTGEALPIDVSGYEIERFDLSSEAWRSNFRDWLGHVQGQTIATP